jgi:hypothetical protein
MDSPAIDPYQQYINYLENVVIYNLKRELSEALASPDPLSSAGYGPCYKCSTCTCELVPYTFTTSTPHLGNTTCRHNTPAVICSLGSSRTTRLIRNAEIKISKFSKACYQYVRRFVRVVQASYMPLQMCVFSLLNN